MKHLTCLIISSLSVVLADLRQLHAEVVAPEDLLGHWVNPAPTGGLTRIQIENGSSGWSLRAWGACSPDDCELPATPIHWVAPTVNSTAYEHAFVSWEFGWSTIHVTITLGTAELQLESITLFHDESGRSNYRAVERMVRVPQLSASIWGDEVIVSWPVLPETYQLLAATNLETPEWTPVEVPPSRIGSRYEVRLPRDPANQFFRLRRVAVN